MVFVLGGFWLHPVSFFITGLVILAGSQYEYYKLTVKAGANPQIIPGLITGITAYCLATMIAAGLLPLKCFIAIIPMIFAIIIIEIYRAQVRPFDSLAHTMFPLFYIALPLSLLPFSAFSQTGTDSILKHNIIFSPAIVMGFLFLLWTNDTMAYLVGVTLGRHRLFERISPKKSWEGFFGGLIFTVAVAFLLPAWPGVLDKWQWVTVAVITVVAGTYGDLAESMLKRSIGIKDSGNIMPGHGGFLDRFDSVLVAFPFFYLYFSLFG